VPDHSRAFARLARRGAGVRIRRIGPLVADYGREASIALDIVVNFSSFPLERLRFSHRTIREEPLLLCSASDRRRSGAAFARQQAVTRRHHRQIAGDNFAVAELFARHRLRRDPASAEIVRRNRRDGSQHALVVHCQAHVRVPVSAA
jgi:hypothetical protein